MENWRGESQRFTIEKFIQIAKQVHGNRYSYSKVVYKNTDTKVIIVCSIHGEFLQTPYKHTRRKQGCPVCGKELSRINTIKRNKLKIYKKPLQTIEQFIEKSKKVHNNKYDYSKVKYSGSKTKVCIVCPEHGEFWQIACNHYYHKCGCPICNQSKGEREVKNWLKDNNVEFEMQKTFDDCKGKIKKLPFDFYLPEYNTLIEYDGEQHFIARGFISQEKFNTTQNNDKTKTQYAIDNNIKLLRIPYWEVDNIRELLMQSTLPLNFSFVFSKM